MQAKTQTKKKLTKSEYYLLPMITDNIKLFNGNIGVFCKAEVDLIATKMPNRIYILFSNDDIDLIKMESIGNLKDFHKVINIDNNFSLIVFRIPQKFLIDYQMFLEGKYSKFSEEFKQRLIKVLNIKPKNKPRWFAALYPNNLDLNNKRKELSVDVDIREVVAKPNIIEETFSLSKLYDIKL